MTRYSCEEAWARLEDFLDRELDASSYALVEEHLQVCEACAKHFAFERDVLDAVRAKLQSAPVPETLRARVFSALDQA